MIYGFYSSLLSILKMYTVPIFLRLYCEYVYTYFYTDIVSRFAMFIYVAREEYSCPKNGERTWQKNHQGMTPSKLLTSS